MKRAILFGLLAILTVSTSVLADVKIKSRQTMSGQSYENTTYIKGKRQRVESMNGQMITITQCDLRRDLQLMPSAKTYTVSVFDEGLTTGEKPNANTSTVSVKTTKGGTMYITTSIKDTGERRQMFGYSARHIIQTIEMESTPDSCNPMKSKMQIDAWVIDETFGFECERKQTYQTPSYGKVAGGCRDKIVPKTVGTGKNGYPLYQKTTFFDANGQEQSSMVQEVVELSKTTLDASLFDVSSDYREVKEFSNSDYMASYSNTQKPTVDGSKNGQSMSLPKTTQTVSTAVGVKKGGVIRIGMTPVKTGSVGEEINAGDLSAAVQNTFGEYLKGTKIELVLLEARLPSAIAEEAVSKECDYVVYVSVSHKKGGGGGFGKLLGKMSEVVSRQAIGSSNIGGQIARTTIVSAATASENIKAKDEISLEIKLQKAETQVFAKQYKAKAKNNGEDVISPLVEQAVEAVLENVGK